MKKTLFFSILAMLITFAAKAQTQTTFTVDNIEYSILEGDEHTVQIGDGTNSAWKSTEYPNTIDIPATVTHEGTTYTVTKIGDKAFNNFNYGSTLTTVTFAENNSITTIGENAFSSNSNLESVNLEACTNLTTISEDAFLNAQGLTSIKIPENVVTIGANAFSGCSALATVEILGSSLETIGQSAFYTTKFQEITLPSSIKTIGDQAFNASDKIVKSDNGDISTCKFKLICNAATAPTLGNDVFISNDDELKISLSIPLCATGYDDWSTYFDEVTIEGFPDFGNFLNDVTIEKTYDGDATVLIKDGANYKTFSEYFTDHPTALSTSNGGITLTITGLKYDNADVEAEAVDEYNNPVDYTDPYSTSYVDHINVKDKPLKIIYSVSPTTGTTCNATNNEMRSAKNGRINPIKITLDDIKPYIKTKKINVPGNYYAYANKYVQDMYVTASDGELNGSTYLTYTNTTTEETVMYRVKAEFVNNEGDVPSMPSEASKIKITPYYNNQRLGFCDYSDGVITFNYGFDDSYDLIDGASIIDETPYAVYEDGTLTFKCGDYANETATDKYTLNTGTTDPGWSVKATDITKVVFDESFALAMPTSCYKWFNGCSSLSTIVGMENYLNVSSVTKMDYMFSGCSSIEVIDISGFQLSKKNTSMTYMFSGCSKLTTILQGDGWRTATGTNMFEGCTSIIGNDGYTYNSSCTDATYANTYYYFTKGDYKVFFNFDGDGSLSTDEKAKTYTYKDLTNEQTFDATYCTKPHGTYDFAYWAGTGITGTNTTTITLSSTDKGNRIYSANWKLPYVEYNSSEYTLTFKYGMESEKKASTNTTYELNKSGVNPSWSNLENTQKVVFDPSFADARPETCLSWFSGMASLTTIEGLQYLYTNEVKDMTKMFNHCVNLTSLNLSNFNTAKVTSMSDMFNTCENLKTIRVGDGWKTNSVTSEYGKDGVFTECNNLVGESGTKYKTAQVSDVSYARVDDPAHGYPGYLTYSKYPVDDLTVGQGAKVRVAGLDNITGLSGTSTTTGITFSKEEEAGKTLYYLTTTADVATGDHTLTIKEGTETVANIQVTVKDFTSDWYHDYWYKAAQVTIPTSNADAPDYDVYAYISYEGITNFDNVTKLTSESEIDEGDPIWVAYMLKNDNGDILTQVIRYVRLDNTAPQTVNLIAQNTTRSYPSSTWGNIFAEGTKLTIKCADSGEGDDESRTDVSGFGKFGFTFDATADFSNPADTKITWITNKDDFADAIDFGDLPDGQESMTKTLRYIAYDVAGNPTNLEVVEFTITKPNFEVSYGTKKLYFYHALDAFGIPSDATNGATITVTLLRDYTDDLPFGPMHIENYDPYDNSVPTVNYVFDFRGHTFKTTNGMGYQFIVKDGSMTFEGEDGDPSDDTKPKTNLDATFEVQVGKSTSSMTINGGNYNVPNTWGVDACVFFSNEDGNTDNANLTIDGGSFVGKSYGCIVSLDNAKATINGGTFKGSSAAIYNNTNTKIINPNGLIFDNDDDGKTYTETYNNTFWLAKAADGEVLKNVTVGIPFTAQYTSTEDKTVTKNFSSLKDALTESNYTDANGAVTITQNVPYPYTQNETNETLTLQGVPYVLDLGKITCNDHLTLDVKTSVTIENGDIDKVTIQVADENGNLTIKKGKYQTEGGVQATAFVLKVSDGETTIEGGEFTATPVTLGSSTAFNVTGGNNTIKGGTFSGGVSGLSLSNGTVTVKGGTFKGGSSGISYSAGRLSLVDDGNEIIQLQANTDPDYPNLSSAIFKRNGLPLFTDNNGFFDASGNQIPEHYNSSDFLADAEGNTIKTVYVKSVESPTFTATYKDDNENNIIRGFATLKAAIADAYPQNAEVTITTAEPSYDNNNAPLTFQTNVEFTLDLGGCTVSKAMFQVKTDNNVTFKSGIYNSGENNNYALDITGGKVALASTTGNTTKFVGTKAAIHNEPATTLFDGLFGFYDDAASPQLIPENYGASTTESITDNVLLGSNNTAVKTVTVGAVSAVCKVSYTYDDNGTTKTFAKEFATLNSALAFIHEITKNVAIKLEMLADHTVSESALYSGDMFGNSSASLDFDLGEHTLNLGGNKLTFKMNNYYGDGVTLHNGSVTSSNPTVVYTKKVHLTCADINIKSTSNATPAAPNDYLYVINMDGTGCLMKSGTVIEAPAENRILPFREAQMELNYEMIDKNGKVMSPDGGIQTQCPYMVTYYLDDDYDVSKVTVQPAKYFKAVAEYSNGNTATKYFGRLVYAVTEDEYKDENGNYPTKVTVTQLKAFATEYRYGKDYLNAIEITHSDFDITLSTIQNDSLWLNISKSVKIAGTDATKLAAYFKVDNGGKLEITGGDFGIYAGKCSQCNNINTLSVVYDNGGEVTISGGTFSGSTNYGIYAEAGTVTLSSADNDHPIHIKGDRGAIVNKITRSPSLLPTNAVYYTAGTSPTSIAEDYNTTSGVLQDANSSLVTEVVVKMLEEHSISLPNDGNWTANPTTAIYGTTVTLTYTGNKKVKEVKVYPMPKSITITPSSSTTLTVGNRINLSATISPTGIADEDNVVIWTSSDDTVATVSEDGTVTAVAAGEATITASTTNGKTATIVITVE